MNTLFLKSMETTFDAFEWRGEILDVQNRFKEERSSVMILTQDVYFQFHLEVFDNSYLKVNYTEYYEFNNRFKELENQSTLKMIMDNVHHFLSTVFNDFLYQEESDSLMFCYEGLSYHNLNQGLLNNLLFDKFRSGKQTHLFYCKQPQNFEKRKKMVTSFEERLHEAKLNPYREVSNIIYLGGKYSDYLEYQFTYREDGYDTLVELKKDVLTITESGKKPTVVLM